MWVRDLDLMPTPIESRLAATLEKDCAVCKEQFNYEAEDPDERIVVSLPCKHPFHEPCIMPWLKSSGTCPVCRYVSPLRPFQSRSPRRTDTLSSRNHPMSMDHHSLVPARRPLPELLPGTHLTSHGRHPHPHLIPEARGKTPAVSSRIC